MGPGRYKNFSFDICRWLDIGFWKLTIEIKKLTAFVQTENLIYMEIDINKLSIVIRGSKQMRNNTIWWELK